ncbi:MAG: response regulator [Cellvibrionaceae bacterium]|nr:response regulator [Cellvibrionaceae bacterium]
MQNSDYKILVVDDESGVRQSFVTYLQDSGFVVYDASDGAAGLALFEQFVPHLVITDLKMPGEDGLVLLKSIRRLNPDTPVIVVSGAGVMSDVVEALRLGAADYLIKPVSDMEVLVHAVHQALERGRLLLENQRYRDKLEDANQQLKNHIASLEQDQRAGHFVQESLSPISPFFARDYVCTHKIIPSLFLSGDCIDYAFLEKRYFSFYLADISGHGSAPAFVSIWLKNLVLQLVRMKQLLADFEQMNQTLNQMLMAINDEILQTRLNNHLTMLVGIIDTQTNELFYSVAGHLPLPVLISKTDTVYLQGKGRALGLYEDLKWQVHHCQLPDIFSLVFFSDGILEILPGKDLLEKEQCLLDVLDETQGDFETVYTSLGLECVNNVPDDIAVLTISHGVEHAPV